MSLVTDSRTCTSAVNAYNTLVGTPSAIRMVYVFKIGQGYAVEDPANGAADAEYRFLAFFDRKWVHKENLATH